MVLQCSKLLYYKVSSEFLRQDSQSSYSFGKIQNVEKTELSEEKNLVFHWRKISYFVFMYIFLLVLLLISSFQIYIHIFISFQWFTVRWVEPKYVALPRFWFISLLYLFIYLFIYYLCVYTLIKRFQSFIYIYI